MTLQDTSERKECKHSHIKEVPRGVKTGTGLLSGAVIGATFGGPTGAAIGALAGLVIGASSELAD